MKGLVKVLERIGFIDISAGVVRDSVCDDTCYMYNTSYQRPAELSAWLDKQVGAISHGGPTGIHNVTGYDLCAHIRKWLDGNGAQGKSLCEVVLTDERFQDLRASVGLATVFWSHLQAEAVLGEQSTLRSMITALRGEDPFIWIDYLCLRQAKKNDFNPKCIVELIGVVGWMVACIDSAMQYPQRSFCILEMLAAVAGRAKIRCIVHASYQLAIETPVEVGRAQTRKDADKKLIDELVAVSVGVEPLNRTIKMAILEGHNQQESRHDLGFGFRTCCVCLKTTGNRGDQDTRKVYCERCFLRRPR